MRWFRWCRLFPRRKPWIESASEVVDKAVNLIIQYSPIAILEIGTIIKCNGDSPWLMGWDYVGGTKLYPYKYRRYCQPKARLMLISWRLLKTMSWCQWWTAGLPISQSARVPSMRKRTRLTLVTSNVSGPIEHLESNDGRKVWLLLPCIFMRLFLIICREERSEIVEKNNW